MYEILPSSGVGDKILEIGRSDPFALQETQMSPLLSVTQQHSTQMVARLSGIMFGVVMVFLRHIWRKIPALQVF